MRTELIETTNINEAFEQAPWACVAIEMDGGIRVWESVFDMDTTLHACRGTIIVYYADGRTEEQYR